MRGSVISALARTARRVALAVILACGAFAFAGSADAGWHGGGGNWHGGGGSYYWHGGGWHGGWGGWHGGGWHGGCCWGGGWGWWGPGVSLFWGWPGYYPYYPSYPYPYAYYQPGPVAPPVQQAPAVASGPPPQQYWYYCDNPKGYYPYVQSCSQAWQPVPASPPGPVQQ